APEAPGGRGGAPSPLRPSSGRVQSPVNVSANLFPSREDVMRNHRGLHALLPAVLLVLAYGGAARAADKVVKYVRFRADKVTAYGVVEGETVHQIAPSPFVPWKKTGQTYPLAEVKLLAPTRPTQVLAMAGNYRSHLSSAAIPEKLKIPQAFFKTPTCIIANEANIVIPRGADNV